MGSGPSTIQQTQQPFFPRWLGGPARDFMGSLMQALYPNGPGGGLQGYNSALNQNVAGFQPMQNQGFGMIGNELGGAQSQVNTAGQTNQFLQNPSLLYASSNPYLQQNVDQMNQQITDAYQFGVAPTEMSQAAMAGAFGGSGDAVQRMRNQFGLGQNLGATDLQAYQQNYDTMLNQMQQASQAAPGIAQAQFMPGQEALQAGGQQQQQQQNILNAGTANAWQRQNFPFQLLQQGMGILTPFLQAFSGQHVTSPNTMSK